MIGLVVEVFLVDFAVGIAAVSFNGVFHLRNEEEFRVSVDQPVIGDDLKQFIELLHWEVMQKHLSQ